MKKTLGWWVAQKQALEAMEATAIAELLSDDDSKRAEALSTLVSISKEPRTFCTVYLSWYRCILPIRSWVFGCSSLQSKNENDIATPLQGRKYDQTLRQSVSSVFPRMADFFSNRILHKNHLLVPPTSGIRSVPNSLEFCRSCWSRFCCTHHAQQCYGVIGVGIEAGQESSGVGFGSAVAQATPFGR
jgi:hypothetical protein